MTDTKRKAPNIDRLMAALHQEKADRIPNFDVMFNARFCQHILGPSSGEDVFWNMAPENAVKLVQAIGQDAIMCVTAPPMPPEGSIQSLDDLRDYLATDIDREAYRSKMKAFLAAAKGTGIGVMARLTGPLVISYMGSGPIPIQSFMLHLYDNPEMVSAFMDRVIELDMQIIDALADLPFDFYYIGDDVADNNGFMISPTTMKEIWVPRYKKIIDAVHEKGKPIMNHCCGNQKDILPYLLDWEVEATHPIQSKANDIYAMKKQVGDRITLVGNIAINLLSMGTREEVVADTREHLARLGGDGAYIACSDHSIIDSVIPENYLAMIETVHREG